ncbi:Spy/CpxP family protein refolding chaperone [Microvirga yunnanensis]|uniref:Spy/CpxP family protein refolding chaperone n=1 Tax=Microvirga yunnanensis TaxID=2953740 RepID=UPI0021CAB303|nr:Spy/CpxP family protein refolding chaperone [Microvirga sp. HBU67655]
MKTPILVAVLTALAGPTLAQAPADHEQHHPGCATAAQVQSTAPEQPRTAPPQSEAQMPMGRGMMQGQGTPGGMMGRGMMGRSGRGMMGRFSPEDMSAFADAQIAAIHAGLKLSAEQEKLWPPIEAAVRSLAALHLSHMQAMRQNQGALAGDRVALIRGMADRMSQGADALRKLADAAAPLYATLDEAQKRRLQVLAPMGSRGVMGPGGMTGLGMMGSGGAMMLDDADGDGRDDR